MKRWQTELSGLLVLIATVYAGLALFWGHAGALGAVVAGLLWETFGLAAPLALATALLLGWGLLRHGLAPATWMWLGGGLAAVGAGTMALELSGRATRLIVVEGFRPSGAATSVAVEAGGWLGDALVSLMAWAVGVSGLYLVIAALLLVSLALTLHVRPGQVIEYPVRGAVQAGLWSLRGLASGTTRLARSTARWVAAVTGRGRQGDYAPEPAAFEASAARAAADGEEPPRRSRRRALPAGQVEDEPPVMAALPPAAPSSPGGSPSGSPEPARRPPAPALEEEGDLPVAVRTDPVTPITGGVQGNWRLPPSSILSRTTARRRGNDDQEVAARSRLLERTLASFGIEAKVVSHTRGPVVTRYEMALGPGIKLSRVVSLSDDLALALATNGVRIEAPVSGKPVIGVEVPNAEVETVHLREVIESPRFTQSKAPLALALGKDVAGEPLVANLERVIHLLIAGATGSGKSVCLASIIVSLLYRLTPDQLRLLLIDPKRVELTVYEGIPHLLAPVVTEVRQAALALRWAVREMEARYQELARVGARHLAAYNQMAAEGKVGSPLPYVVVVIDELADLMLVAGAEVEDSICRLAQMARAAGIHLVIATQRPSTDVITGLIKANIPSRIAFAVSSQVDSRTILDAGGAERLLGRGDMLYHPLGEPKPVRSQGCLVTDREIEEFVKRWKDQGPPHYQVDVFDDQEEEGDGLPGGAGDDPLYDEAVKLVTEAGQASVSMLQRRFRVGYARAARLIDMMEQRGVVGPYQGSKPREVAPSYRRREHTA